MLHHFTSDQLARMATAVTLVVLGVAQLIRPECFGSIWLYFRGARSKLSAPERERLDRAIQARADAEGISSRPMRYAAAFTLASSLLELWSAVPFVLPYAVVSVATAWATLANYLQLRRATERRAAPLVRRNVFSSLPPAMLAATAICMFGTAAYGIRVEFRLGAIVVVLSMLVLVAIAWRIAIAPALLFGDDPQLEYAIDEHVRFCRATGIAALACAPATAFVALTWAQLPGTGQALGAVALLVFAAFCVAMIVSMNPLRKRIALA